MESEIPNVKELDNRPLQSLFIEAKKGYELESVKKENTVPLFRSVLFRLHVNAVKFRKIIDNHTPIIINILRFMKKILFKSTDKQKVIT